MFVSESGRQQVFSSWTPLLYNQPKGGTRKTRHPYYVTGAPCCAVSKSLDSKYKLLALSKPIVGKGTRLVAFRCPTSYAFRKEVTGSFPISFTKHSLEFCAMKKRIPEVDGTCTTRINGKVNFKPVA